MHVPSERMPAENRATCPSTVAMKSPLAEAGASYNMRPEGDFFWDLGFDSRSS